MLEQILSFCVALFLQFITLLSDLMLVPGVSLFAFLAAVFAICLFVRKFINT